MILSQNIQEIQDTMRRSNLQIIGVDENEDFQLKRASKIFNTTIEENFPNLKKEMPMNIKEPTELQIEWSRKQVPPQT